MLDFNQNQPVNSNDRINLAGVVIGNGCVNNTVQNTDEYISFQHETNLIPATSHPKTTGQADAAMIAYIGYTPNYYG